MKKLTKNQGLCQRTGARTGGTPAKKTDQLRSKKNLKNQSALRRFNQKPLRITHSSLLVKSMDNTSKKRLRSDDDDGIAENVDQDHLDSSTKCQDDEYDRPSLSKKQKVEEQDASENDMTLLPVHSPHVKMAMATVYQQSKIKNPAKIMADPTIAKDILMRAHILASYSEIEDSRFGSLVDSVLNNADYLVLSNTLTHVPPREKAVIFHVLKGLAYKIGPLSRFGKHVPYLIHTVDFLKFPELSSSNEEECGFTAFTTAELFNLLMPVSQADVDTCTVTTNQWQDTYDAFFEIYLMLFAIAEDKTTADIIGKKSVLGFLMIPKHQPNVEKVSKR